MRVDMSITSLKDTQFSILELASVRDDKSIQFTLQHALQLAQHAEQLGYRRFGLPNITIWMVLLALQRPS